MPRQGMSLGCCAHCSSAVCCPAALGGGEGRAISGLPGSREFCWVTFWFCCIPSSKQLSELRQLAIYSACTSGASPAHCGRSNSSVWSQRWVMGHGGGGSRLPNCPFCPDTCPPSRHMWCYNPLQVNVPLNASKCSAYSEGCINILPANYLYLKLYEPQINRLGEVALADQESRRSMALWVSLFSLCFPPPCGG